MDMFMFMHSLGYVGMWLAKYVCVDMLLTWWLLWADLHVNGCVDIYDSDSDYIYLTDIMIE